eukprot:scaffold26606_cov124-Isochrysis_galbana.AAC.9
MTCTPEGHFRSSASKALQSPLLQSTASTVRAGVGRPTACPGNLWPNRMEPTAHHMELHAEMSRPASAVRSRWHAVLLSSYRH